MNLRAKCVNEECPAYDKEESVFVGQFLGLGAPNDRMKCASCGQLMKTTQSINTSSIRRSPARPSGRSSGRSSPRSAGGGTVGRKKKRNPKRQYRRSSGRS